VENATGPCETPRTRGVSFKAASGRDRGWQSCRASARIASTLALAAATVAVLATGAAQAQSIPVMTTSGDVQGNSPDVNEVTSFKGIPYAAPPVGRLRWRAPQPALQHGRVLATMAYGNACVAAFRTQGAAVPSPPQSEDCLTLNVWTPALPVRAMNTPKPVMLWIHGGGFEFGSSASATYDGSVLAAQGVVVVSINYRLGVFGFLATSQLDGESGTSGMWGLLDQIAALQWVQQNIANFGGDPNRVTVFGESGGAHAVGMLLASPKTRGLINGAIMQSGAFWDSEHGSINTHQEQLAKGAAFIASFPPGTDLRSVDAATVNQHAPWHYVSDPGITVPGNLAFAPSVDGDVLRLSPAQVFARGAQLSVPMLAGWNAAEYFVFAPRALPFATTEAFNGAAANQFGDRCLPQFQALYPASAAVVPGFPAPKTRTQASAYQEDGDIIIAEQTWEALAIPRRPGSPSRYAYRFSYTSPYVPVASHTAELPFVFGTLTPEPFAPRATATAADRQVSALFVSYWTNFAKNGNPNGPGLPAWPAFTGPGSQVMQLDSTTPAAGPNTDENRFAFIASYRSHGRFPEAWRTLGAPGNAYPGVGCGTATFKP